MADKQSKPPARTPSQIETDLNATRQRLTSSVETLIDDVHPNRIKERQLSRLRQLRDEGVESARSLVFNARGDLRRERVYAVAGGAAGFMTFLVILRALIRRGKRD